MKLFYRDIKTIGKHINNALKEELLGDNSVVAKFVTTASDGKNYQVEYYNLDMILSIGYRVKSDKGIIFRKWANKILKEYMLRGYAVNQRRLEYIGEKAANFLYLIVKNHVFVNGNKRIAATLFIYFLNYYGILYKCGKQTIILLHNKSKM